VEDQRVMRYELTLDLNVPLTLISNTAPQLQVFCTNEWTINILARYFFRGIAPTSLLLNEKWKSSFINNSMMFPDWLCWQSENEPISLNCFQTIKCNLYGVQCYDSSSFVENILSFHLKTFVASFWFFVSKFFCFEMQ